MIASRKWLRRYRRMLGRRARTVLAIACFVVLAGCLYPDELRKENQVFGTEYIAVVQAAVDQYVEARSVLPIKNSEIDTPIYEKYVIDFKKLLDTPYLSLVPPNAFEKGGTSLYVLVDAETEPKVKLLDLVAAQRVNDVQNAVDRYRLSHGGELPVRPEETGDDEWWFIDYKKIGMSEVQVRSVYSGQYLPLMLHESGRVVIQYGPDIAGLIRRLGVEPERGKDLRGYLVENSSFVPVKSAPYEWVDGEPVIRSGPPW